MNPPVQAGTIRLPVLVWGFLFICVFLSMGSYEPDLQLLEGSLEMHLRNVVKKPQF